MRRNIAVACLAGAALGFCLQAQQSGVSAEWDTRKFAETIAAQAKQLTPLLDQIKPEGWADTAGGQAYIAQWNSARSHLSGLALSAENFARQPEKLTAALDTFLRMQGIATTVTSLLEGVRKYQNPALADLLQSILREQDPNRQQLQQYLVELAANKEQEFKVVDQEAQRCRGMLSRQPAAPKRK